MTSLQVLELLAVPDAAPGPADTPHAAHAGHPVAGCPQCFTGTPLGRSAKVAWAIAGIAVALLVGVLLLGVGTIGGTALAFGVLPLLAILACPIVMGGMMWMMMRKEH